MAARSLALCYNSCDLYVQSVRRHRPVNHSQRYFSFFLCFVVSLAERNNETQVKAAYLAGFRPELAEGQAKQRLKARSRNSFQRHEKCGRVADASRAFGGAGGYLPAVVRLSRSERDKRTTKNASTLLPQAKPD
jgi:hypothetical protein